MKKKVKMVKIMLGDGTVKEMTMDEFGALSTKDGMIEAFEGQLIIDVQFYEE